MNYQKVMSEELRGSKFLDVNGQFVQVMYHLHFFNAIYGRKGFSGLTVKLIVLTSFIYCSDHKLFGSKPLPNDLEHDLKVMVKAGTPPEN